MYFQINVDNFFYLHSFTLKMGAKLGNIKAQIGPKIGFLDFSEKLSR